MKKESLHKDEQLSQYLAFNREISKEEKEMQATVMAGMTDDIDVDFAFKKVMIRTRKKDKVKQLVQQLTKVAAILAIPLLIYSAWSIQKQLSKTEVKQEFAEQQFNSPVGMRSHVILPDGTKVWLNAESLLRYEVPFVQQNRKIYLEGEAFLDVASNKNSPFIVTAANTSIEVTGTRFNVKAYPEEKVVAVALQEGSVKFSAVDQANQSNTVEMKPGDHYEVEKNSKNLKAIPGNIDAQISWHKNILVLDDTPLEEVATLLERWYGVKVIITNDELKKYKFSTTFENEPLNRVLELLQLSSPAIKIIYKPGKMNKVEGEKNYSTVIISKNKELM